MNKSSTNIANTTTATTTAAVSSNVIMTNDNNLNTDKNKKTITQEYQVVTPKSPNDINRTDLMDVVVPLYSNKSKTNTLNTDTTNDIHQHSILSPRDSEDIERIKYETVKNELLDKLNLHILLNFKKRDRLKKELDKVQSQVVLLKKLHEDKQLLSKIEKFKDLEIKKRKNLIKSSITFLDTSKNSHSHSNSYTPLQSTPRHYYHTRSKSQGNLLDDSFWKDCIDDPILTSRSSRRGQQNLNKYNYNNNNNNNTENTENKNNNPDTVNTIQKNEKNLIDKPYLKEYNSNPVFKRHDGILVLLTCSICGRQGFIAPQGIAVHVRTKHHKTYSNQKMAVLMNQRLLPDDLQDKEVLLKFKDLNIDPNVTYFPMENNSTNKNTYNKNKPKQKSLTHLTKIVSKISSGDNINTNSQSAISNVESGAKYQINHLEKFCNKDELTNLVEIVQTSKQDLEVILQNLTDNESGEIFADNEDEEDEDYEVATDILIDDKKLDNIYDADYEIPESSLSNICSPPTKDITACNTSTELDSSSSIMAIASRRKLRKRKRNSNDVSGEDEESVVLSWKERLRPAEKKPRPDMIALTELPEHERRSTHYNLRARSKLKSSSVDDDF